MEYLIGKKVEVQTTETLYRGTLIEISGQEIHLQAETGWITIPIDKVVDVREAGQ